MAKTQKKRRAPRASGERKTETARAEDTGLSGYLVVWRQPLDDIPVGLFRTKEAAVEYAEKTSFRVGADAASRLRLSTPRSIGRFAVVTFDNGKPTDMFLAVREYDA